MSTIFHLYISKTKASPLERAAVTIEAELLPPPQASCCVGACAAVLACFVAKAFAVLACLVAKAFAGLACLVAKAFAADVESRTEERIGGEGGVAAVDERKGHSSSRMLCVFYECKQPSMNTAACMYRLRTFSSSLRLCMATTATLH